MISKENVNEGLWNVIKVHYEKECYTDCLKDACLYIIQLVQEKSEMEDLDGEKLITNIFSETNPKLLINGNQTQTEKDEQRGFGFLLRGIVCAIRNPISHKNSFKFTKEEADSILLFVSNYILPKLDDSKDFSYVDNWFNFIFVTNKNDSNKYSDTLLECMSKKEKYSLMLEIINELSLVKEGKYKYIINKLYGDLTKKEKMDIKRLLNGKLIEVGDDRYLRMFFDHFEPTIWPELDKLIKIRIEEMIFSSIKEGRIYINEVTGREKCEGTLGTWTSKWIEYFSNKDEIIDLLFEKLNNSQEAEYVLKYYHSIMENDDYVELHAEKVKKGLKNGKIGYKKLLDSLMLFDELDHNENLDKFIDLYNSFEEKVDYPFDELPF